MIRLHKSVWLFGLLVAIGLMTTACEPTRAAFEVTNDSGMSIDFIYSEDFIDLSAFGRDYSVLSIGDRDTYQGCTQCDMVPGTVYRFEEPFHNGQTVTIAARKAETDTMIFIKSYTWQELYDLDWKVSVTDQSQE